MYRRPFSATSMVGATERALYLLSSTTGPRGTATLVAPVVLILVSAEASVPVVLPFNQTTIKVNVAGEEVNVTAIWEPSYLSFAGQAVILPPQTSASITLHYQAQSPGPIPLGSTTETATGIAAGVWPVSGARTNDLPAASNRASGSGVGGACLASISFWNQRRAVLGPRGGDIRRSAQVAAHRQKGAARTRHTIADQGPNGSVESGSPSCWTRAPPRLS